MFICGWLHLSNISGLKPTPVVQSSSCTHPPLTLVHSRRRGALHLHADVSHFLRVKWTHHHHVYVTKLISPNILQTNPWRPRLCTWKSHGQFWNQHDGCWHSLIFSCVFCLLQLVWTANLCSVSSRSLWKVCLVELIHPHRSSHRAQKTCKVHWCWGSQSHSRLQWLLVNSWKRKQLI